jgi:hypothetical protein
VQDDGLEFGAWGVEVVLPVEAKTSEGLLNTWEEVVVVERLGFTCHVIFICFYKFGIWIGDNASIFRKDFLLKNAGFRV